MGLNIPWWKAKVDEIYRTLFETAEKREIRLKQELLDEAERLLDEGEVLLDHYRYSLLPITQKRLEFGNRTLKRVIRQKDWYQIPIRMERMDIFLAEAWAEIRNKNT